MDFETLEERIHELEELAFANQDITDDESDESEGEFSLLEIFRVVDWEIAEQVNTEGAPPQVRTRETPSSGTTGFPDNRGYCRYAGVVWLQDEVGNKLSWNYIETNAVKEGLPRYPEGRASGRGYGEPAMQSKVIWAGLGVGLEDAAVMSVAGLGSSIMTVGVGLHISNSEVEKVNYVAWF